MNKFELKKDNFNFYADKLPYEKKMAYLQAFEIYEKVYNNIDTNVTNSPVSKIALFRQGFSLIKEFLLDKIDVDNRYSVFEIRNKLVDSYTKSMEKTDVAYEKTFWKSLVNALKEMDFNATVYDFYSYGDKEGTQNALETCKRVYSNLINGENYVDKAVKIETDMDKSHAYEVNFFAGKLDNCVKELIEYRERGQNVYFNFNGHKLYSADVTIDSAYLEVVGTTKAEADKKEQEWREKYEAKQKQEEAKAIAKIPSWIEQGKKFIYPERLKDWTKCVMVRAEDLYHGADLEDALVLMEQLDKGESFEKVKETLDSQDHSGASYGMVTRIIFEFSKKGPEFYEQVVASEYKISDETKQIIEDKKKENAELEEKHKNDNDSDKSKDDSERNEPNGTDDKLNGIEDGSNDIGDEPAESDLENGFDDGGDDDVE